MSTTTFLPSPWTKNAARGTYLLGGVQDATSFTFENTYLNFNGIISREAVVWVVGSNVSIRHSLKDEEDDPVPFFYRDAVTNNTILGALIESDIDVDVDVDSDDSRDEEAIIIPTAGILGPLPTQATSNNTSTTSTNLRPRLPSTTTNSLRRRALLTAAHHTTSTLLPTPPETPTTPTRFYPPPISPSTSTIFTPHPSLASPFSSPESCHKPSTPSPRLSPQPRLAQIQTATRILAAKINSTTSVSLNPTTPTTTPAPRASIYRGTPSPTPTRPTLPPQQPTTAPLPLDEQLGANEFGGPENEGCAKGSAGGRCENKRKRSGTMGKGGTGSGSGKGRKAKSSSSSSGSRMLKQRFDDVELGMGRGMGVIR